MTPEQFSDQAPGRLVEATDALGNRGHAFVPAELPPERDFGARGLRLALSDADQALARLGGMAREIERPDLLFRNFLRREAVLSSKIEGTHTTLADLIMFEVAPGGDIDDRKDDEIVANYVAAFNYGCDRCTELPIGRRLLSEMHEILMRGTNAREKTPGVIRDCLVAIGALPLARARFVPPPDLFVPELLENLANYIESYKEPLLVKLAVAHYQFETIHPFRDGNGRLGRLLITLALHRARLLSGPLLYLSAYLEQHRDEYYDLLLRVSTHGAWDEWIEFFLDGVRTQALDGIARTTRLADLRASYHQKLTGPRTTQNIHRLIDELFKIPAISVPIARDLLEISYPSARALIDRLIEVGILQSKAIVLAGTAYYAADELIHAIDSPIEAEGEHVQQ
ncbi:MAG: Fic family protein [Vulcanimicrobiaceae bacterium]|jgi:Fic family protein